MVMVTGAIRVDMCATPPNTWSKLIIMSKIKRKPSGIIVQIVKIVHGQGRHSSFRR